MDLGLLGPLRLLDDAGREVPLGGAKQRTVLAVLALHAGRPIATDRIIDEVWGPTAPGGALATLQVYIYNLRRALRSALGRELLVTRPPGYLLDVAAGETDVGTFDRLLAGGLAALTAGRADSAVADRPGGALDGG